jgi:hypothetical protein
MVSKSNPFSTRFIRPGAIPYIFPEGESAAWLVERLAANSWRGQIVGPHGTGKSTLLAALVEEMIERGRRPHVVTLHDKGTRILGASAGDPCTDLVLDGFEQINPLARFLLCRRLRRTGCGLLVTAHRSMGLPTLFRTKVELRTALQVVEFLARQAHADSIDRARIERHLRQRDGNLREALFDLYDDWERR